MISKNISKETLEHLYVENGMTIYEIADQLEVNFLTVRKYMKNHGIKSRNTNRDRSLLARNGYDDGTFKIELQRLYLDEKKSQNEIAKLLAVSPLVINRYLKKYDVPIRDHKEANKVHNSGTGNRRWNGGRSVTAEGYVTVHMPGHPNPIRGNYVYEHRLVMEKSLGRYLHHDEHVHHLNGDKTDNRPENLQLLSNSEHQRIEAEIRRAKKNM